MWPFADGADSDGQFSCNDKPGAVGPYLLSRFGLLIEQPTECIVPLATIPPWKHICGATAGDDV